jgi:DNA-binding SARP family transcriptional activator
VVRIGVLGPVEAWEDGRELPLGSGRQRALFVLLLLHVGEVVSKDRLIDGLWGERPPRSAAKVLQGYVSELRRTLPAEAIVTRGSGYLLRAVETDAADFERLLEDARGQQPREAARTLRGALALWRGRALADVEYESWAQAEVARLEALRLMAFEERIEADLGLGEDRRVVPELEALVAEHPLRERLRAQLMLALYRAGRQPEALEVYADARTRLVDELGVEPGKALRELQQAILRQDPALELAAQAGPAEERGGSAFVGREAELGELLAGLEDALAGHGRLFLLVGEPGIGKSRLAEELIRHAGARGVRVLVGRCWEAGGAPAYWPWVQSLRGYIRESEPETLRAQLGAGVADVAQIFPELRELLSGRIAEPAPLDSEGARFRLFDAVAEFLRAASASRPILLVLDDLHAADAPSLLLLQFVARELASSRVLLLGALRDVDPIPGRYVTSTLAEVAREPVTRRISLGGLSRQDVAAYVELTASEIASPELVAALHEETEGNPLFVGETVRLLSLEGVRPPSTGARIAIPQSVRDVIARRLTYLSEECNRVLVLASVLGREFDLDVLASASGLERSTLFELLDEAIAQQILTDVPGSRVRLRFGHALFRDGLYDELPSSRRRQLHRVVGEALEKLSSEDADSHLAELAHHFCEAVPPADPSKAVDYARRAGDHAAGLLAHEEAARLYEMALSLTDAPARPRLLLRTARSIWMAGARGADQAVDARDALVADGDREGAAEAELLLANIHWSEGSRQLVSEHMERAVEFVRDRPISRTTAEVLADASRFHMLADELEDAISLGREGLAIAEQLGLESVRAHCLNNVGVARACSGDLGGLQDLRRAFEIAVAAGDGWATWRSRVNLADCLLWLVGDAERAFAERHELRRLLRMAGSGFVVRFNQAYDAWESYWLGRWTETLCVSKDFIEQVEAGDPHYVACELYSLRALIGVSRSDERALDDARAAVTLGRRAQDSRNLYPAIAFNAQIAGELGRFEEADRLLDELLTHGPGSYPGYVVPLSLAALVCGRVEDVRARLERLGPSPWRDAAAAMLHGDHVEAADLFARIGVLPEEAQARLLGAEAFAAAGRQDDAEAQLARCVPFFESVGATAYVCRVKKLRSSSPDPRERGARARIVEG